MLQYFKISLKALIVNAVAYLSRTRIGAHLLQQILSVAMQATKQVAHNGVELTFSVPNQLNRFRVTTFATKEPETLEWIDSIPSNSVFWDIGANIGLYSCYAAKARGCQVFAFEPSVLNLELLARNINLNNLTDKVVIMPLPLSDKLGLNTLNMTSMEWGGALSTFGEDYGWDGLKMERVFAFQTLGLPADEIVKRLQVITPNYIKIDVDGIEHLILSGGEGILRHAEGVLIEVNDSFHEQSTQCKKLLTEAGLVLKAKRHSEMFDLPDAFGGGAVWNQIWQRENSV